MKHPDGVVDVLVVGAGHAGCEAAAAAARRGARVRLITDHLDSVARMSCNPAIGGIGKSHLVYEIDAMGGLMGRVADRSAIHYRVLNRRKGPAVRATRAQCDRHLYHRHMVAYLSRIPRLQFYQGSVTGLCLSPDGSRVCGVEDHLGVVHEAAAVVITTGTFLGGRVHIGERRFSGGRMGDAGSDALARDLYQRHFPLARLKTGTPPRLDRRTIAWDALQAQPGESDAPPFALLSGGVPRQQTPCAITYTNERTHEIIRANLHRSPMRSGEITGVGPRYCPSIEDKVERFADRDRHQIFLEPEGVESMEVYPNGISTSLPLSVQWDFLRTIEGLEQVRIMRPGYAIEYDFVDPRSLKSTLECCDVEGLFHAGQINGTTGYEEAAAQGLLAGINAAAHACGLDSWVPDRSEAYLGVMVDDLVVKGVSEPYRMFTSRAEFRLSLRQDNAWLRLHEAAESLGLFDDALRERIAVLKRCHVSLRDEIDEMTIGAGARWRERLAACDLPEVRSATPFSAYCHRGDVDPRRALSLLEGWKPSYDEDRALLATLLAEIHYDGYLQQEQQARERFRDMEEVRIPPSLDFRKVHGLSTECRQILARARPSTLGQAGRLQGVTAAALSALALHLHKGVDG